MRKLVALIARHGETALNADGCFRGWLDVPLNEDGETQARQAAEFIAQNFAVKRVLSSPLQRALVTAETFANPASLKVEQHRGLLPWHIGVFAGMPKAPHMDALKLFVSNPEVAPPNGESLQDFENRAWDLFAQVLGEAEVIGPAAMFAHTSNVTVLGNLIAGNRNSGPESGDGDVVHPGGVCAIFKNDQGWYELEPVFGQAEPATFGS